MATMHDISTLKAARDYLARGWAVLPIPSGSKSPQIEDWPKLRLHEEDLENHFASHSNIGIILGEPSKSLVDVDLDSPEAIELAAQYLPPTSAVTGRANKPASHRWYYAIGAKTLKRADPVTKKMIVELRSTGGQTIVGPSVHPSGDRYEVLDVEPATVSAEALSAAVNALADEIIRRRGHAPALPPSFDNLHALPRARDIERRAAAYLDAMPPAISGQGGHNATYAAAVAMAHGFALPGDVALNLLLDRYNPRCVPPWSEKELNHKIGDAIAKPHDRVRGWLRDQVFTPAEQQADISAIVSPPVKRDFSDDVVKDPGRFPERLLVVPGFIGDVVAYNLATAYRPQPVLALAAAICLQAVLAGRKVRASTTRTNVYCIAIGPAACGKDHARQLNKMILYHAGLHELEGPEDIASDSGLMSAVAHQPASLFQLDEFGRFMDAVSGRRHAPHLTRIVDVFLKLFTSPNVIVRGKAFGDRKRNVDVDQPCVTLYGTTVPENFFAALSPSNVTDGLIPRLMLFEANKTPTRQTPADTEIPESILDAARWWGNFKPGGNLHHEHPAPINVPSSADAVTRFGELAELSDAEIAKGGDAAPLWGRASEKAGRLALIHACSVNRESPSIELSSAEWACDVVEYLTRRMVFIAEEWIAEGIVDATQKRILRLIRKAGGRISQEDLCRKTQFLKARERDDAIDNMKRGELICLEIVSTAGRSRTEIVLCG